MRANDLWEQLSSSGRFVPCQDKHSLFGKVNVGIYICTGMTHISVYEKGIYDLDYGFWMRQQFSGALNAVLWEKTER